MNIEKCYIGMAMETEGGFFSPTLNIKMASMNEIFSKTLGITLYQNILMNI